ncbi:MAG: hypothetical protein Ct9H300mP25_05850 [Acidobacteriota bacterium]|nr:MAG: hypothetical protein Ct9H300mP25_05850 [Acidobacteriota bacterium]
MTQAWTQWDDMFETEQKGALSRIHKIKISPPFILIGKLWVGPYDESSSAAFSKMGRGL